MPKLRSYILCPVRLRIASKSGADPSASPIFVPISICGLAMAFGWSAGDILTAINFIFEIAQALDEVDGAAKEFRDASTFLKDLKSALVPLQTFTALDTKPEYKKEIEQQVLEIKIPVERFIHDVRDLQEDLGVVREGHFRHLQNIPSKFKWHFRVSKKAVELQNKVERHLKIIETLMQRLTV
jgi:hypothetical protein